MHSLSSERTNTHGLQATQPRPHGKTGTQATEPAIDENKESEPKIVNNFSRMKAYGLMNAEQMSIKVLLRKKREGTRKELVCETSRHDGFEKPTILTPRSTNREHNFPIRVLGSASEPSDETESGAQDDILSRYIVLEEGLRICSLICHAASTNIFTDPSLTCLSPYITDQEKVSGLEEQPEEEDDVEV